MHETAEIEALRAALVKALAERDRAMGLLEEAAREGAAICGTEGMDDAQVREQAGSLFKGMQGAAATEKKRWATP